ncbi:MAG TPA: hypothetical protein VLZ07_01870 [Syntrophales bacterium]|nr:hypothetical protein [Syntrophales bacterium]
MKKILTCLFAAVVILLAAGSLLAAGPPTVGAALPDIRLSVPQDSAAKSYLDLGYFTFGSFRIQEIKTQVVVI